MIVANRDHRRFIAAVLRSQTDDSWFFLRKDDYDVRKNCIRVELYCRDQAVVVTILWPELAAMAGRPTPTAPTILGKEFRWRWAAKQEGWYPEAAECRYCGGVHLPVVTPDAAAKLLVREKRRRSR